MMDRPPALFWLLPAAIALLRSLPYLATGCFEAPEGSEYLHLGYIPKDFLQYVAFMRQTAEEGSWLWLNPFTTEPQAGRFFMPFLALLGWIAGAVGAQPGTILELSRIPLVFGLFALLWWFLRPILPQRRERMLACTLIGLAGGLEGLARPFAGLLPAESARQFLQSTWHLYGWNTFELSYNPLWLAGLMGMLVLLRPVLAPKGPQSRAELAQITLGYAALHFIHPYSAIGALAIIAATLCIERIFDPPFDAGKWLRVGLALLPALALAAVVGRWQLGDAVYQAASGNILGAQLASPFWYPLTYGALAVLGLRGAALWAASQRPYRWALLAWAGAAVLLHSSPILNGYHFVSLLHIPVCIAAAPSLAGALDKFHASSGRARAAIAFGIALLFANPLLVTAEAIEDVRSGNAVPLAVGKIIAHLNARPPGHTLAPPWLGNVLPAFSRERVWVGHHFLSPDYRDRVRERNSLMNDPSRAEELRALVAEQDIDTVIALESELATVEAALGPQIRARVHYGNFVLLEMQRH